MSPPLYRTLSALQDHARRGLCSAIIFYRGPSDTPVARAIEPQGVVVHPFATLIRAWQREPVDGTRTLTLSRILEVRPSPLSRGWPPESLTHALPKVACAGRALFGPGRPTRYQKSAKSSSIVARPMTEWPKAVIESEYSWSPDDEASDSPPSPLRPVCRVDRCRGIVASFGRSIGCCSNSRPRAASWTVRQLPHREHAGGENRFLREPGPELGVSRRRRVCATVVPPISMQPPSGMGRFGRRQQASLAHELQCSRDATSVHMHPRPGIGMRLQPTGTSVATYIRRLRG